MERILKRFRDLHPLCVQCEREGRTTAMMIRDHIVPLAEGGLDVDENCQALCVACHEVKTQAEQKRGLRRAFPTGRFRTR